MERFFLETEGKFGDSYETEDNFQEFSRNKNVPFIM